MSLIPATLDKNNALYFSMGASKVVSSVANAPELTDPKAGLDPHTVQVFCEVLMRVNAECQPEPTRP